MEKTLLEKLPIDLQNKKTFLLTPSAQRYDNVKVKPNCPPLSRKNRRSWICLWKHSNLETKVFLSVSRDGEKRVGNFC